MNNTEQQTILYILNNPRSKKQFSKSDLVELQDCINNLSNEVNAIDTLKKEMEDDLNYLLCFYDFEMKTYEIVGGIYVGVCKRRDNTISLRIMTHSDISYYHFEYNKTYIEEAIKHFSTNTSKFDVPHYNYNMLILSFVRAKYKEMIEKQNVARQNKNVEKRKSFAKEAKDSLELKYKCMFFNTIIPLLVALSFCLTTNNVCESTLDKVLSFVRMYAIVFVIMFFCTWIVQYPFKTLSMYKLEYKNEKKKLELIQKKYNKEEEIQ